MKQILNKLNKTQLIKVYNFIQYILKKKGNILFIFNTEIKYKSSYLKLKNLLKKKSINYIDIPWELGFLSNYKELKNNIKKKPDLIVIIDINNQEQLESIIKESLIFKIPVFCCINNNLDINITFPLHINNNLLHTSFLYDLFISFLIIKKK